MVHYSSSEPACPDVNAAWSVLEEQITACRQCPRLVEWREHIAKVRRRAYQNETYWGKPITGFGDRQARLLIVGLAPGAHGANRTGRVFTGDDSGSFLFRAMHKAGFASQPSSIHKDDGLVLSDAYITAVCRCAPPDNKPLPGEIGNCLPFLERELELLEHVQGIVALGKIAFDQTLRLLRSQGHPIPALAFGHGLFYTLGDNLPWLLASYHPSRQNTQTGRLTEAMFAEIWEKARRLLED